MKIDYKKQVAVSKKVMNSPYLELILLGHSGAGKSYAIGTLGVKTLFLYGKREGHGPTAASTEAQDLDAICIDYGMFPEDKNPVPRDFTPDESMRYLETILKDHTHLKNEGYKAIAVDGLRVLEDITKGTTEWANKCKTTQGKHNSFKESEATQEILSRIISWLKAIRAELDMHIIVTGIIDVKDKDAYGAVMEAVPKMAGYGVCEAMIQHFFDVAVVGKMIKNGETKYKFQFLTDLTKSSKDEHGNLKKAMNFQPRITGCKPPDIMDANLAELAKIAEGRKK